MCSNEGLDVISEMKNKIDLQLMIKKWKVYIFLSYQYNRFKI